MKVRFDYNRNCFVLEDGQSLTKEMFIEFQNQTEKKHYPQQFQTSIVAGISATDRIANSLEK